VLWVFLVTLAVLAIHPIPECFDCEFPNPWGRDDHAYYHVRGDACRDGIYGCTTWIIDAELRLIFESPS
jgi:hypothetical protein